MKSPARCIAALLAALVMIPAAAQQASPVGLWTNIDDHTGKAMATIRIFQANGELGGRIEALFHQPGEEQDPKCVHCEGARHDQPIVGMVILSGMKPDGDAFDGGQILDPHNGKTYKSKMTLIDGGKKLEVRGYIGTPLFGRTQTWVRAE